MVHWHWSVIEIITNVQNSIRVGHWPNTVAVAKRIASSQQPEQHWMNYAINCVKKGLDYFLREVFP